MSAVKRVLVCERSPLRAKELAVKVVILAGGYGTRFGKVTDFLPKPMIPVGPFPILVHIMRHYAHYGHNEFVICSGYKSELVKDYFANLSVYNQDFTLDMTGDAPSMTFHPDSDGFRPRVTVAYTGQDTMTGSRLKRAAHYLGDDEEFLLTYGDGLTDLDINKLIDFHHEHGKAATLTAVFPPAKFGDLQFEGAQITDFAEKEGQQGAHVNGGFYVFNRKVLDYLDDDTHCVLEKGPMMKLANEGELMGYKHASFWQCMDTTRDLDGLQEMWASGQAPWAAWRGGYRD